MRGPTSPAELRRVFADVSGDVQARSSFYASFNRDFAALITWVLEGAGRPHGLVPRRGSLAWRNHSSPGLGTGALRARRQH